MDVSLPPLALFMRVFNRITLLPSNITLPACRDLVQILVLHLAPSRMTLVSDLSQHRHSFLFCGCHVTCRSSLGRRHSFGLHCATGNTQWPFEVIVHVSSGDSTGAASNSAYGSESVLTCPLYHQDAIEMWLLVSLYHTDQMASI